MELVVSSLRFLLTPAALQVATELLGLPSFWETENALDKKNGLTWLQDNGYLDADVGNTGEFIMSRELAFMLSGLCLTENALVWENEGKTQLVASCFQEIFLLCKRMQVGKWLIAPFNSQKEFVSEMDESLRSLKQAQAYLSGDKQLKISVTTGEQCLRVISQKQEA